MHQFLLSSTSWRGLFYTENKKRAILDLFEKYLPHTTSGYIRKLRPEDLEVVSLLKEYYGFFTSAGDLHIVDTEKNAIADFAQKLSYSVYTRH